MLFYCNNILGHVPRCCSHQLRKLKSGQYSKDGQIKMLRASLAKRDAEMRREQEERLRTAEERRAVQAARESALKTQLDRLATQLQFRDREISEAQGVYRQLVAKQAAQQQQQQGVVVVGAGRGGVAGSGIAADRSPRATQSRAAPVVGRGGAADRNPRATQSRAAPARSPRATQFPSRQSFLAEHTSPRRETNTKTRTEGSYGLHSYLYKLTKNCFVRLIILSERTETLFCTGFRFSKGCQDRAKISSDGAEVSKRYSSRSRHNLF